MRAKYTVKHRRKREGRTNYKKRLGLLKSKQTRLVIRKSNTKIIFQFIEYSPDGDKVLFTYNSSALKDQGWNHSYKSLPAAYLSGLVVGQKALDKKIKTAILDIGLQSPKKGGRIYSALKGVIDAGVKIPSDESIFPDEERLSGKHIQDESVNKDFEKLKQKIMK